MFTVQFSTTDQICLLSRVFYCFMIIKNYFGAARTYPFLLAYGVALEMCANDSFPPIPMTSFSFPFQAFGNLRLYSNSHLSKVILIPCHFHYQWNKHVTHGSFCFFLVLNYINVTIVSLLSHRINCWQGVVVVCLCCGFVTMLVTLYLCNIVLMVCSTKVLCPQNLFFFRENCRYKGRIMSRHVAIRHLCLWHRHILWLLLTKAWYFAVMYPVAYTLRGRSRRGQRRDPQYGAPNFRRCIVHFAHGQWNDTDCVRISSQKTVNLWTKPYFLTFGSACTKTGGTRAP